jgi:phosphoribosylanthranilate isomerase
MRVKICGLSSDDTIAATAEAGAAYVGFVFFKKSPRNVTIEQARDLALSVPVGICKVALTVNASNDELDAILAEVPIDMIQLHGSESTARVTEVKARFGLPVMKAIGISGAEDLEKISEYSAVADQLLIDAKPPKNAQLPGGNGLAFDWKLIAGRRWGLPWMLAGGLTPENVEEAIRLTGATQVDVSSGVETQPGVKSVEKIQALLNAANKH